MQCGDFLCLTSSAPTLSYNSVGFVKDDRVATAAEMVFDFEFKSQKCLESLQDAERGVYFIFRFEAGVLANYIRQASLTIGAEETTNITENCGDFMSSEHAMGDVTEKEGLVLTYLLDCESEYKTAYQSLARGVTLKLYAGVRSAADE